MTKTIPHDDLSSTSLPGVQSREVIKLPDADGEFRAPKDHINTGILQNMISGIPLRLGLGARM